LGGGGFSGLKGEFLLVFLGGGGVVCGVGCGVGLCGWWCCVFEVWVFVGVVGFFVLGRVRGLWLWRSGWGFGGWVVFVGFGEGGGGVGGGVGYFGGCGLVGCMGLVLGLGLCFLGGGLGGGGWDVFVGWFGGGWGTEVFRQLEDSSTLVPGVGGWMFSVVCVQWTIDD